MYGQVSCWALAAASLFRASSFVYVYAYVSLSVLIAKSLSSMVLNSSYRPFLQIIKKEIFCVF